jgi:hypothetical protein
MLKISKLFNEQLYMQQKNSFLQERSSFDTMLEIEISSMRKQI